MHKTMSCVSSATGLEDNKSRRRCHVPFKKINVFGFGMQDDQHYRRGILKENGTHLTVHFKKFNDKRKHSIEDHHIPIKFKDYCVIKIN